ncbi:cytochrome c oxidase assembly protein [Allopontixanthobacter sediminis]|uniref:Cytochrome c oxidase assembly protein n=1 Tax=Allopontixanthobacter sediminis TaxID=1689985 RepID=A0A845AZN2_9SPHN|nr:cytochrome c oxidase assembly protein [Allopontixanthobacter sediminis]MXP42892.1 cytochrome c oxidase assembly protein [Allopontixanthobacter sediminis]
MPSATQWLPYCGAAPAPSGWFAQWNFDPVVLAVVALGLLCGRLLAPQRMNAHYAAAFAALLLFVSPFCALGSALFTARAIHHIGLGLILAPLLVEALRLHQRNLVLSLSQLTLLQALIFWVWHVPSLYSAALSSDAVFWIMQASMTATSAIWWARLRQATAASATAALLATMVQMGALGALLVFADRAYYTPHALTTQLWGWSPLEDQQIAGLIMWGPASAVYLLAAMTVLYRSLGAVRVR